MDWPAVRPPLRIDGSIDRRSQREMVPSGGGGRRISDRTAAAAAAETSDTLSHPIVQIPGAGRDQRLRRCRRRSSSNLGKFLKSERLTESGVT